MWYSEGDFVIQSGVLCKIVPPYSHTDIPWATFRGLAYGDTKPGFYISGMDTYTNTGRIYDTELKNIREVTFKDIIDCFQYDCPKPLTSRTKQFLKEAILYLLKR